MFVVYVFCSIGCLYSRYLKRTLTVMLYFWGGGTGAKVRRRLIPMLNMYVFSFPVYRHRCDQCTVEGQPMLAVNCLPQTIAAWLLCEYLYL